MSDTPNAAPPSVSRRDAIKAAAAMALAPLVVAEDAAAQGVPAARRFVLLKGGTIVSLDPKVGDFVKGDVLIQGKKIGGGVGGISTHCPGAASAAKQYS